jgi:ABC-type Co2+ transport system permease subunit
MSSQPATTAQRIGMFLSVVEACMFGFVAALHAGFRLTVRGTTFSAPFLYPAAIVEALLALALLVSVVLPGPGAVRAGRVLAMQILAVIGVFVGQVALARGAALTTARNEMFYGVVLVLALASIALIASPSMRRKQHAR